MASRAAMGDLKVRSAAVCGNGVVRTAMATARGGRDGKGASPPDSAALGRPSWSASFTTRSIRSSALLF